MESEGRRRRVRVNDSLITDFLDLRDSSMVQTGPKRPRRGGKSSLTPGGTITSLVGGRGRATGAIGRVRGVESARRRNTPRTELAEIARDLVDAAAEVSELTPGPSHSSHVPLTPTPAPSLGSPRRSSRLAGSPAVEETPMEPRRARRSALKDVRSLPNLHRLPHSANARVSFGEFVTVTEYSLESDRSREEVGGASPSGSSSPTLEPVYDMVGGVSPGGPSSPTLEPVDDVVGGVSPGGPSSPTLEPVDDVVGGVSPGGPSSPTLEPVEDFEAEEQEEESEVEGQSDSDEDREEGMATPHVSSLTSKGKSPRLNTPAYSQLQPVRRARASPRRRTKEPRRRPKHQPKTLPRSLMKNLFMLFCKKRLTREAMDLVLKFTEIYLKQASEDLSVYSRHAGRRTIEVSDVILLLRRQRAITGTQSFEYLANTHLPLEYVQELLPCALAGKRVAPKGPV